MYCFEKGPLMNTSRFLMVFFITVLVSQMFRVFALSFYYNFGYFSIK